jgi:hypothetical protein
MSRPVHEQLRQLEAEVQDLKVLPAAAVRARGRRRARRQTAAVMAGVAVVATTAGITATRTLDRPGPAPAAPGQAAAAPAVSCDLTLPSDPAQVRVRVVDAGANGTTATGLRARGFTVLAPTGSPADDAAGPATLRYGPAAIGAAALLRAELIGDTTMSFEPGRSDGTLDLVVGTAALRLATPTEINQALVTAGRPSAPPEC